MSLFFAELRKVWGSRVFPALLAILAAANLLLLWMGTRPTAKQPPASAYRAVGAELSKRLRPRLVTGRAREAALLRPAAVAVHNDGNMTRQVVQINLPCLVLFGKEPHIRPP